MSGSGAEADRRRTVILAEAYRDAERMRGEGDAQATATYAAAYDQAPDFYAFYRSLEAYTTSFRNKDDMLVLSPDGEFFRYFNKLQSPCSATAGAGAPAAERLSCSTTC
ncbi:MAG: hypothetical protein U5L11_11250 [Arhodomonas sp.]|nr:hypothetical protein [Arhodomonas sp.]